ncbi:DJ-1/PfpI family protein [Saccharomonospora iraqiensis]|uniref:DJ-1/PfpI family protein n=1 Tax=Saccharomonospora iraqiensis TaxID=52698 RepID=UPI0004122FA6|nr:DJ-1/PfpI family protein [Saccharomonospora iraqiensis]
MTDAPRTLGIVLFDGLAELDAVGPWEVLAHWTRAFPEDGWSVVSLSPDGDVVHGAKGLDLHAGYSFADAPALDALLYPGGPGTRAHVRDEVWIDWVRAQRASVPLLTSVCTGSLVYAAAGVLRDRPATTHHASLDLLGELDDTIDVRRAERFVDDGDVVTSAGVSAGIDMALHLVARLGGPEHARAVRHAIQYDPEPPV